MKSINTIEKSTTRVEVFKGFTNSSIHSIDIYSTSVVLLPSDVVSAIKESLEFLGVTSLYIVNMIHDSKCIRLDRDFYPAIKTLRDEGFDLRII